MTLFVLAYLAGLFTIATPCILPVLPYLLARADTPFRRGGLPMLLGLAVAFAAAASLAAVAGGWAVAASSHGRDIALVLLALFGLALLFPAVATRLTQPLVALGADLSQRASARNTAGASLLLGVATGLVWAPCAGPVLGLILTGAALNGPGVETAMLLLTYGLGAATSLAAVLLFGRRVVTATGSSLRWGEGLKRLSGAAVIAGTAAVWSGLDLGLLTRLSSGSTTRIEECLLTLLRGNAAQAAEAPTPAPLTGPLRALLGTKQWLNTEPLQASDLQGKVVLVNFWTYSCINCLRALPYVRAWAETYKERGLVVVGVHTPEFAFEKDAGNVRKALANLSVKHPVALDNDFGIWRAFSNRGWPALYLVGADGQIRHQVLGEGRYEQTEAKIRELLNEAGNVVAGKATVTATSTQVAADERNLRSGESYIGYRQSNGFMSPDGLQEDVPALYRPAASLRTNQWSLDGRWTIGGEYATLNNGEGRITHRFHARDLHLVLAPPSSGHPVRFRVTIDGAAPGPDHGFDTDAEGWGLLTEDRLYQLVRQSGAVKDRLFEITFAEPGVRAYAFTFG